MSIEGGLWLWHGGDPPSADVDEGERRLLVMVGASSLIVCLGVCLGVVWLANHRPAEAPSTPIARALAAEAPRTAPPPAVAAPDRAKIEDDIRAFLREVAPNKPPPRRKPARVDRRAPPPDPQPDPFGCPPSLMDVCGPEGGQSRE